MKSYLLAAVILLLSLSQKIQAKGFYLTTQNIESEKNLPAAEAYTQSGAEGIFVRIQWNVIQPEKNRYDWSLLNRVITEAVNNNKKISIGIIAGIYAPEWLSANHVGYSEFTIEQRGCNTWKIYYPWDNDYIAAYSSMMEELKKNLISLNAYRNLRIVKMSAIAQQTLELRLPRLPAQLRGTCQISDQTNIWKAAGYRPHKIRAAYRTILEKLNSIFPDKLISQASLNGQGFPPIDDNGNVIDKQLVKTTEEVFAIGVEVLGKRFAVQNQNLSNVNNLGSRVLATKALGSSIGWQTNLWMGREGAGCQYKPKTKRFDCDPELFKTILDRAIENDASYVEVWPADVMEFQDLFIEASSRMHGR